MRRSVLAAFVALALPLALPLADAADPPGRYQGALAGTPYLISVPSDWMPSGLTPNTSACRRSPRGSSTNCT